MVFLEGRIIANMKKIMKRIGKGYLIIVLLWLALVVINRHITPLTIATGVCILGYAIYKGWKR